MFLVIKETHPKETLRCRSPRLLERNLTFFYLIWFYITKQSFLKTNSSSRIATQKGNKEK